MYSLVNATRRFPDRMSHSTDRRSQDAQAWCIIGFLWMASQLGLTGSIFLWTTGLTSPLADKLSERYSREALVLWTIL